MKTVSDGDTASSISTPPTFSFDKQIQDSPVPNLTHIKFWVSFVFIPCIVCSLWLLIPLQNVHSTGLDIVIFETAFHGFYIIVCGLATWLMCNVYFKKEMRLKPLDAVLLIVSCIAVDIGTLNALKSVINDYQIMQAIAVGITMMGAFNFIVLLQVVNSRQFTLQNAWQISKEVGLRTCSLFPSYFCYIWCQIFTWLYFRYIESNQNDIVRTLLGFSFTASFFPLRMCVLFMLKFLMPFYSPKKFRRMSFLLSYMLDLLFFSFYRNLFTELPSIWVVIALVTGKLFTDDILRFVLPMTSFFMNFRKRHDLVSGTKQDILRTICEDYFMHVVAGLVSGITFVLLMTQLRFSWNGPFFGYNTATLHDNDFKGLLLYYFVAIAVDFAHAFIVNIFIKKRFQISLFQVGIKQCVGSFKYCLLVLVVTIHVTQDVYLGLLKYNN